MRAIRTPPSPYKGVLQRLLAISEASADSNCGFNNLLEAF